MVLKNVLVELFDLSGTKITEARTNNVGNYELFVPNSGQYKMKFTDEKQEKFEWYDEQLSFETAQIININKGDSLTINEDL